MQATAVQSATISGPGAGPAAGPGADARTASPDDISLAADLYALISHLHKNCNSDLFEAVGAIELSLSQIKLLHHLDAPDCELTLKQGAEAIHVSLPAASRLVDDLVTRGCVARHEDATDRRMKRIRLTDRGREVIARINAARLTGLEQFVGTLSDAERRGLHQVLAQLLGREEIASLRPEVTR